MTRNRKMDEHDDAEEKLLLSDPYYDIVSKEYKDLLKNRTILLNGDITENVIERVVMQIQRMSIQSPKTPITIIINSYGGSLYDSQAVVDAMRTTKTPITTIVLGKAMSAGFNIFLAGDLRIVHENSILMCHSGSQSGNDTKIADAIDDADFLKRILVRFSKYYASRTKITESTWLQLLNSGKDTYFFADESIDKGIAHEMYQAQPTKYLPEPMRKRKVRPTKRRKRKVV